jgi:hypothetical protein
MGEDGKIEEYEITSNVLEGLVSIPVDQPKEIVKFLRITIGGNLCYSPIQSSD